MAQEEPGTRPGSPHPLTGAREVTDPKVLAFLEELLSHIDLKEELYQLGLQLYADEFYGGINARLVVIKEIEYTPAERQLTA
jgi:hypothetical protein